MLDYQCFKDHYIPIAVDLSKQNELNGNSRAIQQIEFYGVLKTNSQVCTVLEKSKKTMLIKEKKQNQKKQKNQRNKKTKQRNSKRSVNNINGRMQ